VPPRATPGAAAPTPTEHGRTIAVGVAAPAPQLIVTPP
jgi:hypothetical protein